MKKLAVIASAWHFPIGFYKTMAAQEIPNGLQVDFFCVSHRDPKYAVEEKREFLSRLGWGYREVLDRILYERVATVANIEALGWRYKEYPNTVGDWGNANQWLEEYDYKQYDMLLITHDDNLLVSSKIFVDLVLPESDWLICTNSKGIPQRLGERLRHPIKSRYSIRGSFELFKREMIDMIGGRFDLGKTSLTRVGEKYADLSRDTLQDWNKTTRSLRSFIDRHNLSGRLKALSPYYRVSRYCIEGERGFISLGHERARRSEEKGLALLQADADLSMNDWLAKNYKRDEDEG